MDPILGMQGTPVENVRQPPPSRSCRMGPAPEHNHARSAPRGCPSRTGRGIGQSSKMMAGSVAIAFVRLQLVATPGMSAAASLACPLSGPGSETAAKNPARRGLPSWGYCSRRIPSDTTRWHSPGTKTPWAARTVRMIGRASTGPGHHS
jgi:hypothetical protein